MEIREYYRLASVEEKHWWYCATHELVIDEINKGWTFGGSRSNLKIPVILDAGCGTGGLTKKLEKFAKVTGLDISPLALKLAEDKNLELVEGSVNSLPFQNSRFDLIASISVLYHQQVDDRRTLKEFNRVLRPGGKIILIVPAFDWMRSAHDQVVHTKKRYTLLQITKLMKASGLAILDVRYIYGLMFPVFVIKRLLERIFPKVKETSDLIVPPTFVNDLLFWLCRLEWDLGKFIKFPFGSSLLVVGEKK